MKNHDAWRTEFALKLLREAQSASDTPVSTFQRGLMILRYGKIEIQQMLDYIEAAGEK